MAKQQPKTETENTETVDNMLELNIDDCLMIRPLSGTKPYTNTKEGSRYHGMSYRTFLYKGKGFTVISDDAFCKDIDEDNVDSVMLKSTDDGYEFLGHLSISRADRAHYTKQKRKAFTVEFIQNSKIINPEEFA